MEAPASAHKARQSNWAALKVKLGPSTRPKPGAAKPGSAQQSPQVADKKWEKLLGSKILALDCEMVGIGFSGKVSALARCSVVDFLGNVVYDEFVQPKDLVTDFRTKWSGIRKGDISNKNAVKLDECQKAVAKLFKGKILVGHSLKNDLTALLLSHPKSMIRDTSRFRPLMRKHGAKYRPRALRDLTKELLGKTIQQGEHDSVEDARCTLEVYKLHMEAWEAQLREQKKARMLPKKGKEGGQQDGQGADEPGSGGEDEEVDGEDDEEVDEQSQSEVEMEVQASHALKRPAQSADRAGKRRKD